MKRQKRIILLERWFQLIDQLITSRQAEILLMLTTTLRTGLYPDPAILLPIERQLFDDVRAELAHRAEVAARRREAARRRRAERRQRQAQILDDAHRAIREYRALTDILLPTFTAFHAAYPGQKPKSAPFALFLLQQQYPDTWPDLIPHLASSLSSLRASKRPPAYIQYLSSLQELRSQDKRPD